MKNIIHIFGASGSGTTTLGKAISEKYGHTHLDTDYYFWSPTNPPYKMPRERSERIKMLGEAFERESKCVISGSLCGWGDVLIPKFELCIWLQTPAAVRIERIEKRELSRFGERIMPGGDMHKNHTEFVEWAKTYDTADRTERSFAMHNEWKQKLTCPVLILDGTKPVEKLLEQLDELG